MAERRTWLERLHEAARLAADDLAGAEAPALGRLRADALDLRARLAEQLAVERCAHPRLLVFLHGTTLMHAGAAGRTRVERVAQARDDAESSLRDYAGYVPSEGSLAKLHGWSEQGARISYLSSHRLADDVAADAEVLRAHGFPPGPVLARRRGESYGEVAERAMPDILIEDDCESIGAAEIAYGQMTASARGRVRSIVVPEFGGLSHLADDVRLLLCAGV